VLFQERKVAREVHVTDGGHRYLELRVEVEQKVERRRFQTRFLFLGRRSIWLVGYWEANHRDSHAYSPYESHAAASDGGRLWRLGAGRGPGESWVLITVWRLMLSSFAAASSSSSMDTVKSMLTRWMGFIILPELAKKRETSLPLSAKRAMVWAEGCFFLVCVFFTEFSFCWSRFP